MTGRGKIRLFRPSANPVVKLGLTLTTSSPTLDPSLTDPFYLIVTVRILSTPRPNSPITLATHLNALGGLSNRSFANIVCKAPEMQTQKQIEIFPRNWPHYISDVDDLRDIWDFVTVPVNGKSEIRHQVSQAKIAEAQLEAGEIYQASFTDMCPGTRWWAFGSLEDFEGVKFRIRRDGEEEEGADGDGKSFLGEVPDDLALVIEHGTVDFAIGQKVL